MSTVLELRDCTLLRQTLAARPPPVLRGVGLGLAAIVVVAVTWASLTTAALVVRGAARVRPVAGPTSGFFDSAGDALAAPVAGTLARLAVTDGQRVVAGEVIYALDSTRLDLELTRLASVIAGRGDELANLDRLEAAVAGQGAAAAARVAAELASARADERAAALRRAADERVAAVGLDEAQAELRRIEPLVVGGAAPAVELDHARLGLARARADVARAQIPLGGARGAVLVRQQAQVAQDAAVERARIASQRLAVRAALAQAQAERAALALERDRLIVRAPLAGTVTVASGVAPGAVLAAGQPVVALVPDGGLRIDAAVPGGDVGRLAVGMAVEVTLDGVARARQPRRRGTIRYISPDSEVVAMGAGRGHVYLVSVELAPGAAAGLRPGMTGIIEVAVGRRRVIALLFDRIPLGVAL